MCFFFFKQKTAYEMRISDWSSDVCSSDLKRSPRCRLKPGTTAPWEPLRARILHPNSAGHMGSEGDVSGGRWRRIGPDAGERRRRGRANEPFPTEFGIAHRELPRADRKSTRPNSNYSMPYRMPHDA